MSKPLYWPRNLWVIDIQGWLSEVSTNLDWEATEEQFSFSSGSAFASHLTAADSMVDDFLARKQRGILGFESRPTSKSTPVSNHSNPFHSVAAAAAEAEVTQFHFEPKKYPQPAFFFFFFFFQQPRLFFTSRNVSFVLQRQKIFSAATFFFFSRLKPVSFSSFEILVKKWLFSLICYATKFSLKKTHVLRMDLTVFWLFSLKLNLISLILSVSASFLQ